MTDTPSSSTEGRRTSKNISLTLGFFTALLFFIASGYISYSNTRNLRDSTDLVAHTHEVITGLDSVLSLLKDAETGQRGFVITGDESYLEPYNLALGNIPERLAAIETLTKDNATQQSRIPVLKYNTQAKLDELAENIEIRREKGFNTARDFMAADRGKNFMDTLRNEIGEMRQEERGLREERLMEMDKSYRTAVISGLLAALLGLVLTCAITYLLRASLLNRRRLEWMQSGEAGLSAAMLGDQTADKLGENVLKFLAEYLDAHAGAFFIKDSGSFRRVSTYGVPSGTHIPDHFEPGNGLLGQAVKDKRAFHVNNVPDGYLTIGSGLGQSNPRHLVIAPALNEAEVNAVFELGFIHPLNEQTVALMDQMSEIVGVAVQSANYRTHLQNLLEETQRQTEELQAQGEELRVSNEELEEQSRALKESQIHLEQQQVELEQTNSQLEEQTTILENQRDDLERARSGLSVKARELEQASQYKSDFLANMSHELRTPLNSSLILAKLLADNPQGNLSDDQVKYAQTIQRSGNDLLTLINDILDLSKIEAGHMEIHPESMPIDRMLSDLTRTFEPMAKQKGLTFTTKIAPGCPETVETDRQRLEQVLKNLLSNALKFTEKGSVELSVKKTAEGKISFAVTDTGIGIAPNKQQAIFEAFHQADGTISRKYGGTGLGLSISRELTRLLGGALTLTSEHGKGSTFIITINAVYNSDNIAPRTNDAALTSGVEDDPFAGPKTGKAPALIYPKSIKDDRETLSSQGKILLIIEDDNSFASILYDLAHELHFECLVSNTAEDALILARQYLPHAVILDVGLPDHSGLTVLDRLKRDQRTRHIPVHVVSASDASQTALSLGAIGYMGKPVKREDLVEALKKIEIKLSHTMKRILIVEDDAVQQDAMRKLLGSHDVETTGVSTAAECLEQLKQNTFDCMVLDLSLPDASGYFLLETLSKEDAYTFPPVIVYTGRDLSADEEQKLRRYSKSIIIKGAKSPERLLDEVTLFLHQVVSDLPAEQQRMLKNAQNRDSVLEKRRILVVEDDVANIYALSSILEPRGAIIQIARNGLEALNVLKKSNENKDTAIDLVLMDVMMPEMDGLTATREIRKNAVWKKLPIIMLTAKAMKDDQERCLEAGANDYMAKPLDVEKLLSLVRVWMPR